MNLRNASIWKTLDWWTILLYLILIVCGWFSVCGASYEYGNPDFLDLSTRAGKQLLWIACSFGIAFILLMLDDTFYRNFSYIIYIGLVALLLLTIFIARDVKGSQSWLHFGPVSLQPAEFGKFATALALARFMNSQNFSMKRFADVAILCIIILTPLFLIIMQKETGSALVYLTFFLVLYREGMPGVVLFLAISAVLYFIFGIKYDQVFFENTDISVGEFIVLGLSLLFTGVLVWIYTKNKMLSYKILLICGAIVGGSYLISTYLIPFDYIWVMLACATVVFCVLIYHAFKQRKIGYALIGVYLLGSILYIYSTDYVFNKILQSHQRVRIELVLGMLEDHKRFGYNVNQSKIAIGSGGLTGKGFLNGTQTKLKYVPEQDTDFIFCTIGEEMGFVGSVTVLILFLVLILRLIALSERQSSVFCRAYGYSVASVFMFHLFINIGMVIGLLPVIGIPLPFFSYGGSSLWGFTILLFIFLRLDAGRAHRLNG